MAGQALVPWRSQKHPQAPKPWLSHKRPQGYCPSSSAAMDDYDVFLNHRGPDVKGGFVAHLHEALRSAGLNPFLDKKCLVTGALACGSIDAALEGARVHVAVVSKGYADSKYCLSELAVMMRSRKPVIPVFYDVEPANLRRVEVGSFAAAFKKHKSRESTEQVDEWADALGKLADITGICFRLSDYKGDEVELKWKVVDAILPLMPTNGDLQLDHHLIGVEGHMNACVKKLEQMCHGTSVMGLVGMGGVGKTTLAKMIYNHFIGSKKFQATSFLEIDRNYAPLSTKVGPSLLHNLQKQVLWDLLYIRESSHQRYKYLFRKLSRQGPVLVVLDDIQDKDQFDKIIFNTSLLAPGSCIIVTSRDRHILNTIGARVSNYYVYEVTPLDCSDSQKLFNLHVFQNEEAPENFKASASDVAIACNGLPLALKVVGSSLCDKKSAKDLEHIWPEAIDALGKDIESTLKWSYDCLSKSEKLMFVDIACIFYGWKEKEVLEVWKGCKECISCGCETPNTSLQKLIDKSLVIFEKLKGYDTLIMHGLLQDMGQSIGKENGSHLLDDRGVRAIEDKNQETCKIRALSLINSTKRKFEAKNFARLNDLHYLILDGCDVRGNFGSIFKELRYLRWRNMGAIHLPPLLDLSNLVSLDFSDSTRLANLWTESNPALEACPNLLRLNLSDCTSIVTLPNSIGCLSQLQLLDLRSCVKLHHLPSSIGQLRALRELLLGWCKSLEALPESISKLSALQWLFLGDCSSLSTLPYSIKHMASLTGVNVNLTTTWQARAIGQFNNTLTKLWAWHVTDKAVATLDSSLVLTNLDHLTLFGFVQCPSMTKLPQSIGFLSSLEFLELHGCAKVQLLPNSIGDLKALKQLRLKKCNFLQTLPDSLGAMASLQLLLIVNCPSFTKLPSSIGNLSSLREVDIQGCGKLMPLPDSFMQLRALVYLAIMDCGGLEKLGVLRVLHGLCMWACTSITKLLESCLIVEDIDFKNPTFGIEPEGHYPILRRLREREEVKEDKIDNNVGTYYMDENVKEFYPVWRKLKEVKVVEKIDCGLLRIVQDDTRRTILQCLYKSP